MKNLFLVLLVTIPLAGCASTSSINTTNCIKVANQVENNEAKSGDDLYNECLDRQY